MANAITFLRIICAMSLFPCPVLSGWFYCLYLVGGISDLLDGFIARRLKTESRLGAQLDTAADALLIAVVLIKMLRSVPIPRFLIVWILCIAVIKCLSLICGIVLHGRFITEHTAMNKACGILIFAIPFCVGILPRSFTTTLIVLTCAAASAAAIQEGFYILSAKEIR